MDKNKPEARKECCRGKVGIVTSAKMAKTVVVEVERLAQHPRYKKVIKRRKSYMVHDEKGIAKVGDKIRMVETRPLSKMKHWRLAEVLTASTEKK
jgi:small subunit ribosomal protein S17